MTSVCTANSPSEIRGSARSSLLWILRRVRWAGCRESRHDYDRRNQKPYNPPIRIRRHERTVLDIDVGLIETLAAFTRPLRRIGARPPAEPRRIVTPSVVVQPRLLISLFTRIPITLRGSFHRLIHQLIRGTAVGVILLVRNHCCASSSSRHAEPRWLSN